MYSFRNAARVLADRMTAGRLRAVAYVLTALLCYLAQMTPHGFPAPFGARILPLIPLTVFAAMYAGPVAGAWTGFVAGLFWDVYADRLFGMNALILLLIGCVCGLLVRLLMRNNLLTALLLCAAALLVHSLLDWLLNVVLLRAEGIWTALLSISLPNCLYTWLLSPLLYFFFDWMEKKLHKRQ